MDGTEPSPLRLQKALVQGDSPIAPATMRLAAFGVVGMGASAALKLLAARFDERLREAVRAPDAASATSMIGDVAGVAGPLLAVAAAAAVVTGLAQTGGVVRLFRGRSGARSSSGLAWLSSGEPWASSARAAAVLAGLGAAALVVLRAGAPDVAATTGDATSALHVALALVFRFFQLAVGVLFLGASLDVLVRRAAWQARWRRSPSEARREQREQESPAVAQHARKRARDELLAAPPSRDDPP